ncbi:MAG TPA: DUF2087 domain-containing protein [Acidimicrobiia bacterium]|nr:DUF2087 domain-containing protein [Acidimicrobiia bacterium]
MSDSIGVEEFVARIEALCIGGSNTFPKRARDRHVLLASATLWMEPGGIYTEAEVNEGLRLWLEQGCPSLQIDVVTLRRELVDRVYLDRDDAGHQYSPGPGPRDFAFDPAIGRIDPKQVIKEARLRREQRKQERSAGEI